MPNALNTHLIDEDDAWRQDLGVNPDHVRVVPAAEEARADESMGLQMVSLRLPKEAIEQLKTLARAEGLGYQPYVRQLLMRHIKEASRRG